MNEQQRLFFAQARSDYRMFRQLRSENQPACHVLHCLQMSTEKLARVYLWKHGVVKRSHAAFSKFLRSLAGDERVRLELGFKRRDQWSAKLDGVVSLVESIQQLAPDLAGDGPNPEYPWPPNRPETAPIEFAFPVSEELGKSNGRTLLDLIDRLFVHADRCF
jgi:hypothetical protein